MPITPQHATPAFVDVTITGTPPPLPVPTPMPLVEQAEGVVNILLLGSDQEHISGGVGRTDVIVVASIYPDGPTVSLLSIPRDLYVWIPSYGFDRINTAYGHGRNYPGGGPALVKATIEYNLGIPIHYYALVDFAGFVQIVNTVGGVDVAVECELHDTFPDPANPEQSIDIDLYPGIQHLDGQQALWYVRSRWSTSDFDRNRRQQQVLRGLYRQTLNAGLIPRIPELWDAVQATVQTDLGLSQVVWLGWIGSQLDWSNVKSRFIAPPFITPWTAPNGAAVYLPVPDAIGPLVTEALQPPATGRANQPAFRVEIWDGTGGPGLAEVAAERLRWEGFIVTAINPAGQVYERTRIVDFTTTTKGTPLWLLLRLYNRTAADVTNQPTEGAPFDFQVLLGADYNPCLRPSSIYYVPPPTPTPTPATTPG
jgi:LCP family protein required for cell wall assembly